MGVIFSWLGNMFRNLNFNIKWQALFCKADILHIVPMFKFKLQKSKPNRRNFHIEIHQPQINLTELNGKEKK